MNVVIKIGLFLLSTAGLYGCYRDNAATLYPGSDEPGGTGCDTTNISYAVTIKPILLQNCALAGCHTGPAPTGGYDLENYGGVESMILANRLIGAITHQPGYTPMPKNAGMLNDCLIGQITSWVNQGAKNN